MKKHLTFKDDKSDKFWSIETSGTSYTVTYGKADSAGQTSTKEFDTDEKCLKEAEKLVNEKLKKGYVDSQDVLINEQGKELFRLLSKLYEIKMCLRFKRFIEDGEYQQYNLCKGPDYDGWDERMGKYYLILDDVSRLSEAYENLVASEDQGNSFVPFSLMNDNDENSHFLVANVKEPACPIYYWDEGTFQQWAPTLDSFLSGVDLDKKTVLKKKIIRKRTNSEKLELKDIDSFNFSLPDVKFLTLSGSRIKELPEQIDGLVNLKELSIYCKIKELPASICNLTKLEKIIISEAPIKTLPECISQLVHLRELDINYSKLTLLPDSFSQLKNLKTLHIGDSIKRFPEPILTLDQLEELSLIGNNISSVPENIKNLIALRILNLMSTRISSLPSSITTLANLTILDLRNTPLTSLPDKLEMLTNLTELYISEGTLNSFPEKLPENLKILHLES